MLLVIAIILGLFLAAVVIFIIVIQEIQKDIDHIKQQSEDQIERGRRRFVELWEQCRETHDTINENEVLEMLSQAQEELREWLC